MGPDTIDAQLDAWAHRFEADLDREAEQGWCSYPSEIRVDYHNLRVIIILADDTLRILQLSSTEHGLRPTPNV